MFSVAIFSIKDLKKYLLKAVICVCIIAFAMSFFRNSKSQETISKTGEKLFRRTFLECLDISVPGMKQMDFEIKNGEESVLEKMLGVELKVANNVKLPDGTQIKYEELSGEEQEELKIEEEITEEVKVEVIENSIINKYTNSYGNVQIKNETEFPLTEEILKPDTNFKNSKNILIFHTHTCESYTASETNNYQMEGNYRTTNLDFNVGRVGRELANFLKNHNFNVTHDATYHDFPAYSGSYDRSYTTVGNILQNNIDTEIIFDIHRDSIGDSGYAPTVKIGDEYAAQIMFVIGTNGGGLEHPNWVQNLKTAIKIQEKANEKYPGLFKPIMLRNSRYNQNMAPGASIIEVGATGNTLEQSINSMKYLSEILAEIF